MLKSSSLILKLQCMALWRPAFKGQYLNFYYVVIKLLKLFMLQSKNNAQKNLKLGNTLTAANAVSAFDDM